MGCIKRLTHGQCTTKEHNFIDFAVREKCHVMPTRTWTWIWTLSTVFCRDKDQHFNGNYLYICISLYYCECITNDFHWNAQRGKERDREKSI